MQEIHFAGIVTKQEEQFQEAQEQKPFLRIWKSPCGMCPDTGADIRTIPLEMTQAIFDAGSTLHKPVDDAIELASDEAQ